MSGIFRNVFKPVFKDEVVKFIKKNGMTSAQHPKYKHIWYGFFKGDTVAIFTWDSDESELRSDYSIIELERGMVGKKRKMNEESLDEKELSAAEEKKKEEIVKAMKKDKESLKKEYGDDWESVMYAIATKKAKELK